MKILGLNHGEINSAAALVVDGEVVAGAAEERFTREKKTKDFPLNAIRHCLEAGGLEMGEVDAIAQAWNPGAAWIKFNPLVSGRRIHRENNFYAIPDNLYKLMDREVDEWVKMSFPDGSALPPVYHIQHHRTHSANSFYLSEFDEAAILTADWRGEFETTTLGMGRGNTFEVLASQKMPHSLGAFYAAFTELLGYQPDSEEWKVMALSAYDVDASDFYEKIRGTVHLLDDGLFELDQNFYKPGDVAQPHVFRQRLVDLLGGRTGEAGDEPDAWTQKVAVAMQKVSEEIAVHMLDHLHDLTGCPNVVLGGGYFMNCVFNGKVTRLTDFRNVYIPHAPGDNGNCIGAALYLAHNVFDEPRIPRYQTSYLGPDFSGREIEKVLERRNIPYRVLEDPAGDIARLLAGEGVVAVFNGAMEFGERALGNRSILGDPRSAETKDKINSAIKYREAYRPFAPAVAAERVHEFFEVEEGYRCPYMEKVVMVREEHRSRLGAITHIDGSARAQTVDREENAPFYDIIEAFGEETGVPVVLNTSFNVAGEPIVHSPDDALTTFYNSGLRHLVLGHRYLVQK